MTYDRTPKEFTDKAWLSTLYYSRLYTSYALVIGYKRVSSKFYCIQNKKRPTSFILEKRRLAHAPTYQKVVITGKVGAICL